MNTNKAAVLSAKEIKQKKKKHAKARKNTILTVLSIIVLVSLAVPIIFLTVRIFQAPSERPLQPLEETGTKIKADYICMLINCVLGVVAMILPACIAKTQKLTVPSVIYFFYVLFLYCSIFLGEVRQFYDKYIYFDSVLHAFSGVMIGALGFSFISFFDREKKVAASPGMLAFFAFCFAVTLGAFWEVFEFTLDFFGDSNMQTYRLPDGTVLAGREALYDTMKDIILDISGAALMSIIGYISLKYKKGWLEKLLIRKSEPQNKEETAVREGKE